MERGCCKFICGGSLSGAAKTGQDGKGLLRIQLWRPDDLPWLWDRIELNVHQVLVNRLRGLSLSKKSVVRLTDRPDMTIAVYRGCKQQQNNKNTLKQSFLYTYL